MIYIFLLSFLCCSIATAIRPLEPLEKNSFHKDGQYNYRLPNNTKPETYDITLKTYLEKDEFHFDGSVKIQFRVLETTSEIKLHHRNLKIHSVNIVDNQLLLLDSPKSTQLKYDNITDILTINTRNELIKGKVYSLIIDYKGELIEGFKGFFKTYFIDSNGKER